MLVYQHSKRPTSRQIVCNPENQFCHRASLRLLGNKFWEGKNRPSRFCCLLSTKRASSKRAGKRRGRVEKWSPWRFIFQSLKVTKSRIQRPPSSTIICPCPQRNPLSTLPPIQIRAFAWEGKNRPSRFCCLLSTKRASSKRAGKRRGRVEKWSPWRFIFQSLKVTKSRIQRPPSSTIICPCPQRNPLSTLPPIQIRAFA